jgi:hypothetical protein
MYADRKARINTYGDSFTQCEQVSDGETWQERLAAHLGEPIRNFGVGGYGVYEAYRRMVREERTDHGAEYLILYICCDDSTRSLYRAKHTLLYPFWDYQGGRAFEGNFWPHVEMDLNSGHFVEKDNPLPTQESLYHMTEPQWMVDHLKDDLALQLDVYSTGFIQDLDRETISKLAASLDFPFDWSLRSQTGIVPGKYPGFPPMNRMQAQASALLNRYSQRATVYILDKARAFARQNGKKLLVVLNLTTSISTLKEYGTRDDQETLDYLVKNKVDYFDMNEVYLSDSKKYNLSFDGYMKLFFVGGSGHYSPYGNNFFALSIKDKIVDWLDPKPITYQRRDPTTDFSSYLRGRMGH